MVNLTIEIELDEIMIKEIHGSCVVAEKIILRMYIISLIIIQF
jgi:hypothetical protein